MRQFDQRPMIALDDPEETALAPDVMAFPLRIFARRFALLLLKMFVLLLDPIQFGSSEDANGIEPHPRRRRNTHRAVRRIHAEVDVLDVFPYYVDGDVAQFQLRRHQYSPCALMITKIRSTSDRSFRSGSNAALMMFSRAWTPRQPSGRTLFTVSSMFNARRSTGSVDAVNSSLSSETRSAVATRVRLLFRLLNSARRPGLVLSNSGVSSACPAATFPARSAIRFKYSSYSIALALRAAMISSSSVDILS